MYYTIYKITNLVNGKIYIGKHETSNLDDGYMGSGKHLRKAIIKYGIQHFHKEIIFFLSCREDMNEKEKELVTEEFVARSDNYNIAPGGNGGWKHVNNHPTPAYTLARQLAANQTNARIRNGEITKNKLLCKHCSKEISKSNIKRHELVCKHPQETIVQTQKSIKISKSIKEINQQKRERGEKICSPKYRWILTNTVTNETADTCNLRSWCNANRFSSSLFYQGFTQWLIKTKIRLRDGAIIIG